MKKGPDFLSTVCTRIDIITLSEITYFHKMYLMERILAIIKLINFIVPGFYGEVL